MISAQSSSRCRWAVISLLVVLLCVALGLRTVTHHDHDGGIQIHGTVQLAQQNLGDHHGNAHRHRNLHSHKHPHKHDAKHVRLDKTHPELGTELAAALLVGKNLTASQPHTHYTLFGFSFIVFDLVESISRINAGGWDHAWHPSRVLIRVLEIRSPIPPASVSLCPPAGSIASTALIGIADGRDLDPPVPPPPKFVSVC